MQNTYLTLALLFATTTLAVDVTKYQETDSDLKPQEKGEGFDSDRTSKRMKLGQSSETSGAFDFSKVLQPGLCPENIKGMENIDYSRLTGDWFL